MIPVTRRDMLEVIEHFAHILEENLASFGPHAQPFHRRLEVLQALSLKLRMEESPNAQD